MFDIAPSEFLLVAFIALVVIGPKDLPKALRVVGYWVGRARAVGRQFRSGFDEMVREAELAEMEKKWKAENERIMREHAAPAVSSANDPALPVLVQDDPPPVMTAQPQMIEHPHVVATDATVAGKVDEADQRDPASRVSDAGAAAHHSTTSDKAAS
jgi:sec-independent protein translocase protein TatB